MGHRTQMEGAILHIVLDGAVTLEDLLAVTDEVRALEGALRRAPNRIVDLTNARSFGVGYQEFSGLARQRSVQPPANRYRIAFVASSDVGFGLARMYEELSQHADVIALRVDSQERALQFVTATAP